MWAARAYGTCAVLPRALQGPGGCSERPSGCASPPQALPSWLLLLVKGQGQVLPGPCTEMTYNVPKQAGPRVLFIAFLIPLPSQGWEQSPP